MIHSYTLTGMTCSGCEANVKKILSSIEGVLNVETSLAEQKVSIELSKPISIQCLQEALKIKPNYQLSELGRKSSLPAFWNDKMIWKSAGKNTFNCLVGCSIGDFGMIIYLQTYHHYLNIYLMMALAIVAGLTTSIILETILLKLNEKFSWNAAFKKAIGMSLLSMITMELAENATDLLLTSGQVSVDTPFYWVALSLSMIAGFVVPLPYNYYKLKKYNKACH
jgi:copper chaperone CopZ